MGEPAHFGATLTGYRNAVSAARSFLVASKLPVDEDSFERLAELRGNAPPEKIAEGFVIKGYDELQRLCDIAEMVICMINGRVFALAPEEWQLQSAVVSARQRAVKVGPLHALWDVIFDAEALLAGKETLSDWGPRREAIERLTAALLGES